jgi:hypothetical protein
MVPWMRGYAKWLASHPGAELTGTGDGYRARHPTSVERVARATEYAGRAVQVELVRILEKRADFREYFQKLLEDTVFHAKELARDQIARNFEIRDLGLTMAAEKGDHKAIEHYTRPFVEHGFPKKAPDEERTQRVTINLIGASPEQQKRILGAMAGEPPDEIEWELIPNEQKLLGDGDELG